MYIEAIRNFTVNRSNGTTSLKIDQFSDYESIEISSSIIVQLKYFLLINELEESWNKICPQWIAFPELDDLTEDHMKMLDQLNHPKLCLNFMEVNQVLEKANSYNRELYSHFLELVALWQEGYNIFIS
ncbi:hypothetical protein HP548_02505 [Paenibacillus taichungensis]|uniref:Uncharacterized protein n=1 Tax=Paenibacillus taichungensis TaxID=484184 RepID=A0ABX2MDE7_9BACL|nr:hypothetical protein [Paenibacillus taichungensis]NUU52966.1 hypothetical protein [Paenibacillus taichungensis]